MESFQHQVDPKRKNLGDSYTHFICVNPDCPTAYWYTLGQEPNTKLAAVPFGMKVYAHLTEKERPQRSCAFCLGKMTEVCPSCKVPVPSLGYAACIFCGKFYSPADSKTGATPSPKDIEKHNATRSALLQSGLELYG